MLDTGWRSKADRPFVPPRVIVEVESEDETQLPKDQPLREARQDEEDNGRDFVPVSSAMLLEEGRSEDENGVPFFAKTKQGEGKH